MIDHLWQSTLFAILVASIVPLFRKQSAALRFWLWFCASAKFLFPFSLLVQLGDFLPALPEPARVLAAKSLAMTPVLNVPANETLPSTQILWIVWAAGALLLAVRGLARWYNLHAALRDAPDLPLAAPVPIKQAPSYLEPALVGIWRPVIMMPRGIVEHLSPCEMRAILAHELCHLSRRDNLLAQVQILIQLLFWFHPLVWWIGRRLVIERERACDEKVLEAGNAPETYVEGILKICRFHLQPPLPCTAGVADGNLQERVKAILTHRTTADADGSRILLLGILATATVIVPLMAGASDSASANLARQVVASVMQAPQLPDLRNVPGDPLPPPLPRLSRPDVVNAIPPEIVMATAPIAEKNVEIIPASKPMAAQPSIAMNITISGAFPQPEEDRQVICKRQTRSSETRLLGPRICLTASAWAEMQRLGQGFGADGRTMVAADSFEKSRSLNPPSCVGMGLQACGVSPILDRLPLLPRS